MIRQSKRVASLNSIDTGYGHFSVEQLPLGKPCSLKEINQVKRYYCHSFE